MGTAARHHRGTNGKRGAKYSNRGKAIRGEETQETATSASAVNVTAWRVGIVIPNKDRRERGAPSVPRQRRNGCACLVKITCAGSIPARFQCPNRDFYLFINLSKLTSLWKLKTLICRNLEKQ